MAYELQAAKIRQKIRTEEMQITVVERKKQIEIEEQVNLKIQIWRAFFEIQINFKIRKLPAEKKS